MDLYAVHWFSLFLYIFIKPHLCCTSKVSFLRSCKFKQESSSDLIWYSSLFVFNTKKLYYKNIRETLSYIVTNTFVIVSISVLFQAIANLESHLMKCEKSIKVFYLHLNPRYEHCLQQCLHRDVPHWASFEKEYNSHNPYHPGKHILDPVKVSPLKLVLYTLMFVIQYK